MAGATVMMITYGHQVISVDDEFIKLANDMRDAAATFPGSQIVDLIPICEVFCSSLRYHRKLTSLNLSVRFTPT